MARLLQGLGQGPPNQRFVIDDEHPQPRGNFPLVRNIPALRFRHRCKVACFEQFGHTLLTVIKNRAAPAPRHAACSSTDSGASSDAGFSASVSQAREHSMITIKTILVPTDF